MGVFGLGPEVPGGGFTPKKNQNTGKWDRPVSRQKKRAFGCAHTAMLALSVVLTVLILLAMAAAAYWVGLGNHG